MTELNQLIKELDNCETVSQVSQVVKQLNKCILQTLSSSGSSDGEYVLEAFRAMTRKALPIDDHQRNSGSNSKAISLIIFDNMRQLLIKVEAQKLSLSKEIISELLFMTIGSAKENKCKLIELLVKISDSKSVEHLLNEKYSNFLIKSILNKLKINFNKNSDLNETNAIIFEWFVSLISSPEQYIHDLLPLTMKSIDEFSLKTKLIGLRALRKLIADCWSQLMSNGSDLLIVDRLENLMYSKELEVLEVVFECLLQITRNYRAIGRQEANESLVAFDTNDQIMCQSVNNISMSSDIKYRVIHLKFIDKFLPILNSRAIKHSKSYVKVLCDIIEETICRKNCDLIEEAIESLNAFMRSTWIAITHYCDKCLLSLLKLSVNLNESDLSSQSKKRVIQKICISISIMKNSDKNSFALVSKMIINSSFKHQLNELIVNSFVI